MRYRVPLLVLLAVMVHLACRGTGATDGGGGGSYGDCECPALDTPPPVRIRLPCGEVPATAQVIVTAPCYLSRSLTDYVFDAGDDDPNTVYVGYGEPATCIVSAIVDGSVHSSNIEIVASGWYPCGADAHGCGPSGFVASPAVVDFRGSCDDGGAREGGEGE